MLSGWSKCVPVQLTSSATKTDYQVKFIIHRTGGANQGDDIYVGTDCNADYSDIRFTDYLDTIFSYWIESYDSSSAVIWVKIPSLALGKTYLYLQYGNLSATSLSSGTDTFDFFDDFSGPTLDSKWHVLNLQPYSITDGVITISGADNTSQRIYSDTTFGIGYAIRSKSSFSAIASNSDFGFSKSAWGEDFATFAAKTSDPCMIGNDGTGAWGGGTVTLDEGIHEIQRVSSVLTRYYKDSSLLYSMTNSFYISTSSLELSFVQYTSGTSQSHDWFIVRKVMENEPTKTYYTGFYLETDVSSGVRPLTVTFDIIAARPFHDSEINYGDGNTHVFGDIFGLESISHIYTTPGVYTVYISGYDIDDVFYYYQLVYEITVTYQSVTASFTSIQTVNSVAFTDTSTGVPDEWYWDFGDGSFSRLKNPTHVYKSIGTFTVVLHASNQYSYDDSSPATITIVYVLSIPVANFSPNLFNVITDTLPYSISFTNLSEPEPLTVLNTLEWDFGNDTSSSAEDPTASYADHGTYTITLTVTNSMGSSVKTGTLNIVSRQVVREIKEFISVSDSALNPVLAVINELVELTDAVMNVHVISEIVRIFNGGDVSKQGNDEFGIGHIRRRVNMYGNYISNTLTSYGHKITNALTSRTNTDCEVIDTVVVCEEMVFVECEADEDT